MSTLTITDQEFAQFQRFIFDVAGISLSPAKKALVCGRLAKRVQHCSAKSYGDYFRLLAREGCAAEMQIAVDLLTTNETYFFREQKHFDFLRARVLEMKNNAQPVRLWSAASSSGEEAYSMAMVLSDCLGNAAWDVVGSDISVRMLQRARVGHYTEERGRLIAPAYLKRFCLKGMDQQQGTFLVQRELRSRVQFMQVNLNAALPRLGPFDIIFLRNVMIYFNGDTKRQVVERVLSVLKPGGYLCIGHSESLNSVTTLARPVAASIYQKPA
ncbi:MAG: protein-glutamate O-methyltransferase CheR [Pseudomonadota bacterium]